MRKDGGTAFPAWELNGKNIPEMNQFGMSKRFYAAVHAMQGMIANTDTNWDLSFGQYASQAFEMADALLAEEERE